MGRFYHERREWVLLDERSPPFGAGVALIPFPVQIAAWSPHLNEGMSFFDDFPHLLRANSICAQRFQ